VLHRLVEQLARRAHRRPDHLGEAVHVLAALLGQAEDVGQDLEHVGLRDFRHGVDRLALAGAQAVEQLGGARLEDVLDPFERARAQRVGDDLAHLGVARRVVGQQDLGARAGRVVPRARGRGERLPVEQAGGDVLVAPEHVRAVGEPHHRRELAQRVVDRARVAHRIGREDVERVFGDRPGHSPSPSNRTSSAP
jgi:hypothetical protein